MQSVLGVAPEGIWKHRGIKKYFSLYAMNHKLFDRKKLKDISEMYEELYNYRKIADYEEITFNKSVEHRLYIYSKLIEEVQNNVI